MRLFLFLIWLSAIWPTTSCQPKKQEKTLPQLPDDSLFTLVQYLTWKVKGLKAVRDSDERNAEITWQPLKDAVGYNVLWGIGPDKLYQTYQVWAEEGAKLKLRALTKGQSYCFAVEAFNENGVTLPSSTVTIK